MAYAGYLLYMYLNARKWTLVSSSFAFPFRPPLAVAYGLPVVPQTKQQKVNNLEATDERATNANAQHAAHMG